MSVPKATYRNDLYSVFVRDIGFGALHVSFHRHDRRAIRDWRHMQAIKNEVAGPERIGIEVFPPESKLTDQANEYHLWILPEALQDDFPYLIQDGLVTTQEENVAVNGPSKARQRDWEEGITTGRGMA